MTEGSAEISVDYVVAFGAPGDVVGVAKGVDLESANVGGEEHEVRGGGGEHVPGVEVEEGHEEVDAYGGTSGDDKVGEDVVAEVEALGMGFKLADYDVDAGEGVVGHDYCVDYHGGEVELFGALGPVAHGEDELCAD